MEFIIGGVFLLLAVLFLLYFCKNLTVNININYPEPQIIELKDQYTENGDPVEEDGHQITFDEMLKDINDLMLGKEDSNG